MFNIADIIFSMNRLNTWSSVKDYVLAVSNPIKFGSLNAWALGKLGVYVWKIDYHRGAADEFVYEYVLRLADENMVLGKREQPGYI